MTRPVADDSGPHVACLRPKQVTAPASPGPARLTDATSPNEASGPDAEATDTQAADVARDTKQGDTHERTGGMRSAGVHDDYLDPLLRAAFGAVARARVRDDVQPPPLSTVRPQRESQVPALGNRLHSGRPTHLRPVDDQ